MSQSILRHGPRGYSPSLHIWANCAFEWMLLMIDAFEISASGSLLARIYISGNLYMLSQLGGCGHVQNTSSMTTPRPLHILTLFSQHRCPVGQIGSISCRCWLGASAIFSCSFCMPGAAGFPLLLNRC